MSPSKESRFCSPHPPSPSCSSRRRGTDRAPHLNQYPRPSFTLAPGAPAELLGDLVMERFLFDRHRANELGAKFAAVVEEKRPGISSVDRRRLDDGARALAAIEPPQTDSEPYATTLSSWQRRRAMQSLEPFRARPTERPERLHALQEKWKDAECKLTALRPLRVLESPTRERESSHGVLGNGSVRERRPAAFVAGLIRAR